MSGDRITLRGVRATGYHGVFEHERRDGQEFVVDVELSLDLTRAGESDDLADTYDYGALASTVVARVEGEPYDLIERLAAAAHPGLAPDRTLVFDCSFDVSRARLQGKALDRFEREDRAFFERVRAAYLERARAEPQRMRVIDASAAVPRIRKALERELADL